MNRALTKLTTEEADALIGEHGDHAPLRALKRTLASRNPPPVAMAGTIPAAPSPQAAGITSYASYADLERAFDGPIPQCLIDATPRFAPITRERTNAEQCDHLRALRDRHIADATKHYADRDWSKERGFLHNVDLYTRKARQSMDFADECDRQIDALEAMDVQPIAAE